VNESYGYEYPKETEKNSNEHPYTVLRVAAVLMGGMTLKRTTPESTTMPRAIGAEARQQRLEYDAPPDAPP
jgi:hypothetical protein